MRDDVSRAIGSADLVALRHPAGRNEAPGPGRLADRVPGWPSRPVIRHARTRSPPPGSWPTPGACLSSVGPTTMRYSVEGGRSLEGGPSLERRARRAGRWRVRVPRAAVGTSPARAWLRRQGRPVTHAGRGIHTRGRFPDWQEPITIRRRHLRRAGVGPRQSLVSLAQGIVIRSCRAPKSTSTAFPSSTPMTRPRP